MHLFCNLPYKLGWNIEYNQTNLSFRFNNVLGLALVLLTPQGVRFGLLAGHTVATRQLIHRAERS